MPNVFQTLPPARVRVDLAGHPGFDVVVPAMLVMIPARDGSGAVELLEQHADLTQLAAFVETAIRIGAAAGIMDRVFGCLVNNPTTGQFARHDPPASGTIPPDDLPPHLRGGRRT